MLNRLSLRYRIYAILTVLILVTLIGGVVTVWYSYRIEAVMTSIIDRNLIAYETAQDLETALVNQKGFVSYYFLDADPEWIKKLGEYRQLFKEHLNQAVLLADDSIQKNAVEQIKSEYLDYIRVKDLVIHYYEVGERTKGYELHAKARDRFFRILSLCENYKDFHKNKIATIRQTSAHQAKRLRMTAVGAIVIDVFLAILLSIVLINQILVPVRKISMAANPEGYQRKAVNEIQALHHNVQDLIEDVDQTHFELVKSRENLLQSEKMALVGKLAAGMAHSLRNPFTSVKMRMFSLGRGLDLSETQKDDFNVIDEEIRHIDQIVQNFLEFSRPPKLKMQTILPSAVVDNALQLLEHRLKSYDVEVTVEKDSFTPAVEADPEQLKEVLVNIIVNACEAMTAGGLITIEEGVMIEKQKQVAVIRISDSGPGIPEAIRERIFQPFFTTKDEGTGLGLSIAARIIEEHGGRLTVSSNRGKGAVFSIALPVKENIP